MVSFAASLLACAGIISMGYFAGRVKLIGAEGSAALGVFIGRFSLPALLFTQLASLSFKKIKMRMLVAVLVTKVFVFVGVLAGSLTFDYRGGKDTFRKLVGTSALRAIFCTQSNDFALGLPVMTALFNDKPDLVSMLYLLSPISLLLLNPIGFLLMGYSAKRDADEDEDVGLSLEDDYAASQRRRSTPAAVIFRVAKTPIVVSTMLGMAWNVWPHFLPVSISFMLETLGDAFTPCALFFTGLSLVGKVAKLTPARLLLPATLTVCKVVVLALTMYLAVGLAGGSTKSRSFAFCYGAIPTAPSVLVYAHEYIGGDPKVVEQIAVSLVLCTIAATPVLFVAGILINEGNSGDVESNTRKAAVCLSAVSAVLSGWLVASFGMSWHYERKESRAALPRGQKKLGWRPGDSRVLLLLIIAVCHAIGSANSATCFSGLVPMRFTRYLIGCFCRLAACGAAAAAALLPPPPPHSSRSCWTRCCPKSTSKCWKAKDSEASDASNDPGYRPLADGDGVSMLTIVPLSSSSSSSQPGALCMRNINACCEPWCSQGAPLSPPPESRPPPPLVEAPSSDPPSSDPPSSEPLGRRRNKPSNLATLFNQNEDDEDCKVEPMRRDAASDLLLDAPLLGPSDPEVVAAALEAVEASEVEPPGRRIIRAIWCSCCVPLAIGIMLPCVAPANKRMRREDPCGFVYGSAQYAATSFYLTLCLVASIVGLKRTRKIVDVRYNLLRAVSSSSLSRLAASNASFPPLGASPPSSPRPARAAADDDDDDDAGYDTLPGGNDTVGANDSLAGMAATIARQGVQDETNFSTKLATTIGHRMMLLIIVHGLYAFTECCACFGHLAPLRARDTTTRVLFFIAATFSSSLGIFNFFIFGLAKKQPLWRMVSKVRKAFCLPLPQFAYPSTPTRGLSQNQARVANQPPRDARRRLRDVSRNAYRIDSVDVNEV